MLSVSLCWLALAVWYTQPFCGLASSRVSGALSISSNV